MYVRACFVCFERRGQKICVEKKKRLGTREDASNTFLFVYNVQASAICKTFKRIQNNNLQFVYFLAPEERVNSKKAVLEGTQNRIKNM